MNIALGVLIALTLYSAIAFAIFFPALLIVLLVLRRRKAKTGKTTPAILETILFSLAVSLIASPNLIIGYTQLHQKYLQIRYQVAGAPQSYPHASVDQVVSFIGDEKAEISFNLTVKESGTYKIIGALPCYKQVSPPTLEEEYRTPQVFPIDLPADEPAKIEFVFAIKNTNCDRDVFPFDFTLKPQKTNLFGKDYLVVFSGNLERIKLVGAEEERRGYPLIYTSAFSLKKISQAK